MRSTSAEKPGRTVEHLAQKSGSLPDTERMSSAEIATAIERLCTVLDTRRILGRETARKACRDLHRGTSFVAHVGRLVQ